MKVTLYNVDSKCLLAAQKQGTGNSFTALFFEENKLYNYGALQVPYIYFIFSGNYIFLLQSTTGTKVKE